MTLPVIVLAPRPILSALPGVLLLVSSAFPQEALESRDPLQEEWRWAHFTAADGLPSGVVTEIREAPDGTVWVATPGGLAWYDGWIWHGVPPVGGSPAGAVRSLTVDAAGEVWAVAGSGLHRGGRNGFRPVPLPDGALSPLSVVRLQGGGILLLARSLREGRLALLRSVSGQLRPVDLPVPSPSVSMNGLVETDSGRAWLATTHGEFSWSEEGWRRRLPFGESGTEVGLIAEEPGGRGLAWVLDSLHSPGLWEWDADGPPRRAALSFEGDLAAAAVAGDGEALALYREGGVHVRREGRWPMLSSVPEAFRDAHLLRYRPNGDLWTATPSGLFLCHLKNRRWTHWSAPAGDLRGNYVNEIMAARDGTIWLATSGGVAARRPDGTPVPVESLGEEGAPIVTGLAEDSEGRIWASSGSGFTGVRRWDGARWRAFDRDDRGQPLGYIHKVRTDRNGRTWLLSLASRTGYPSARDGTVHVISDGTPTAWVEAAGLKGRRFYDVDVGRDGATWFATSEGLDRWKDGAWRHWLTGEGGRSPSVKSVVATGDGGAWAGQRLGSRSGGLARIGPDGSVRYVMGESPYIGSGVWGLSLDDRGRLWVATEVGLACIQDDCLTSFDQGQGLRSTNLWPLLSRGNRVYAGTRGSGTWILDLDEFDVPLPRVNPGKPVVDEDAAFLRWTVHPWWGTVSPGAALTRHRLDGGPWSAWSTETEVMVRGEARGEHTLAVQARGPLGKPTEVVPIPFRVRVPLLRRWEVQAALAGALAAFSVAGLLLLGRRQRINETIRRSEERLSEAQRVAGLGFWDWDIPGDALYWSDQTYGIFGVRKAEFAVTYESFLEAVHPGDRELVREKVNEALVDRKEYSLDHRIVRPSGEVLHVHENGEVTRSKDGAPVRMLGTVLDITERRKLETRLMSSRDHLRALARRLQTVRDEEQVRISRDLHDDFGQILTGLKLQITRLRSSIPEEDSESLERIDSMAALLNDLFQALRRIGENLRPPLIEDLGLEGALERLVTEFSQGNPIQATVKCWLEGVEVDGDRALAAYRIVQESLTNVSRHSGASRVRVTLKEEEGSLLVQVADDGRGMEPDSGDRKGSLGILGMGERVAAWGGEVSLRSAPGSGVEVAARIPLGARPHGGEGE